MDECPHCGEPIDENAQRCPHCGSDYETGWNPDGDYYSVELPDEDAEHPGDGSMGELRWEKVVGLSIVALTGVGFAWVALRVHGSFLALPFIAAVVGCILLFYRWLRSRNT